jgi:hypothetical protein
MGQSSWSFVAFDPNNGRVTDFLDCPSVGVYTRRLDDYCQLDATITNPKDFFSLQPYSSSVMALRDGVCRFRGRVVDPYERTPRTRIISCKDAFHNMYWRRVRKHLKLTKQPDDMAFYLMHLQNTYKDTGIRAGSDHVWGDAVTRKFQAGDTVADEVKALALTHGDRFHFKINALLDEDDLKATAAFVSFKASGPYKSGVRFEFGGNTLENVQDYQVEYAQVVNRATVQGQRRSSRDAIGKSTSDGNCVAGVAKATPSKNPPITEAYVAGESEHDFGLWEDEYSQVNKAGSSAHLLAVAKTFIYAEPPRTITITPNADAPSLFDDFDVGDRVRVKIHDYDFTLDVVCTVWEVVVEIDSDSGQEKISTISFINLQDTSA